MSYLGLLKCAVLGSILYASPLQAQEAVQPSLESKPITSPWQEQSTPVNQDDRSAQSQSAHELLPTLQNIEGAIRSLKAGEDQKERERKEDREVRDLNAQEEMALWAKGMFWATAGSVVITFFALGGVLGTLRHTRRAADYAEQMVVEAKKTTDAALASAQSARDATNVAKETLEQERRNFQLSGRPYVLLEHVSENTNEWRRGSDRFSWRFRLVNYGANPALVRSLKAGVALWDGVPLLERTFGSTSPPERNSPAAFRRPWSMESENIGSPIVIKGGKSSEIFKRFGPGGALVTNDTTIPRRLIEERQAIRNLTAGGNRLNHYLIVVIDYEDVHGNYKFNTAACLRVDTPDHLISEQGGSQHNYRS